MTEKIETIVPDNGAQNPDLSNKLKELEKQLSDAQTKISQQGEELKKAEQITRDTEILGNVIQSSPELKDALQKQYQRLYNIKPVQSQQEDKKPKKDDANNMENEQVAELAKEFADLKGVTKATILKNWEDKVGLSKMDPEKAKVLKKSIETEFNKWGQSVQDVPEKFLEDRLTAAYNTVVGTTEDTELKEYATNYNNLNGALPHFASRNLNQENETTKLTEAQSKYANAFGLDLGEVQAANEKTDDELLS